MSGNPYRWQHDRPAHLVAREELVGQLEGHLRRGVAVKLVGGRGMGKSVLLRQVQARFASEPDTRAVLVPGPPDEGTLVACVRDIATRLGIGALPRTTMDAVMEAAAAKGIDRLILLVDEADQYVLLGSPGEFARVWFNHLEALRKEWMDRVAVVIAGGLGILHVGHVLGSGLVSRAETCVAERFRLADLRDLASPFETQAHDLGDEVLETLEALSGGNPALATYGLERLWDSNGDPIQVLRAAFGEFPSRHGDFLRAAQDAVSHRGLMAAPGRILEIVRQSAGSIPQQLLREACTVDDPPVDVAQAVQLLQAAGLVGVGFGARRPVGGLPDLLDHQPPPRSAVGVDPAERLDADIAAVLAQLHRFGRDFHGKNDLLDEQVFSSLLAVGLVLRGWSALEREAVQAAGYPDLRVQVPHRGHALIEMKIWPRNDYKEIQWQLDAYRVSDTVHAVAVTLGAREVAGWADDYERECLAGCAIVRRTPLPDLVGWWRVETPSRTSSPQWATHFVVQIPKRR